jgi:Putative phage tail protein
MSKVLKTVLKVAAVVATFFIPGVGPLIGKALVTAAVSIGVSRLVAGRANTPADAGAPDAGGRVQLAPATQNKLPVVYGSAFIGGAITDAMLSTDQKTMWYVVALAEVSDDQGGGAGVYTFDTNKCYYDGKQIIFGSNGAVTALRTNTTPAQDDTRCNGFLYVYLFNNGSSSGVNTGGQTAQQILSVTNGVPSAQAWTVNHTMTNCAFAIIKVIYSTDAGTTGIGALTTHITNSITKPGDAILDYMLNTRYGCALPISSIDTASLTALNTYSDELIDYIPASGSTTPPLPQQARYRINGPLDTGQNCLNNLQFLVDSCDSWLQYSELTGKWRVVINKLYTGYPDPSGLFLVDSSNLVGGIEVSPIDLNETYNQVEVAYPNTNIKDQTDYQIIDLFVDDPQLLSANEAINRLNITLPLVNNAVQAKYLAQRRIYQSREDLVIAFTLDYSGIQVEAGDVIRVTHEVYGWTDKLFRVSEVSEEKDTEGNLFASIRAFEYSDGIYADVVQDYVPAFNTGLKDPNVISPPGDPTITTFSDSNALVTGFDVTSAVPESGLVLYMDFNYGNSSNVLQHRLYRTVQQSNGAPFINSPDIANGNITGTTITVNDLPAANYYWSTTARNNTAGKRSGSSPVLNWGGANIQPYDPNTATGGVSGNQVKANTLNLNNMNSGLNVQEFAAGYFYLTSNPVSNTVITPVDITGLGNITTGNWDTPKYLDVAYSGSLSIYPLYVGDASTTEGYLANSTSSFNPGEASQFDIYNGDYNWWVLENAPLAIPTGFASYMYYTTQIVANANCTIQIVPFLSLSTDVVTVQTQLLDTINLTANNPIYIDKRYQLSAASSITHNGILIRSLTASANIVFPRGRFVLNKGYAPT